MNKKNPLITGFVIAIMSLLHSGHLHAAESITSAITDEITESMRAGGGGLKGIYKGQFDTSATECEMSLTNITNPDETFLYRYRVVCPGVAPEGWYGILEVGEQLTENTCKISINGGLRGQGMLEYERPGILSSGTESLNIDFSNGRKATFAVKSLFKTDCRES